MAKTAVVLFNLGGPDAPQAVRPFLFNLFFDPAIIRVVFPLRLFLAWMISRKRTKKAQEIYAFLGGKSPIVEHTKAQARALEIALKEAGEYSVFFSMRYWHPRAQEVIQQVQRSAPDQVILLPLYPQFSTTTTASSFDEWAREAERAGFLCPTRRVCCYPTQADFITAQADAICRAITEQHKNAGGASYRFLFSAHGLPQRVVDAGDPYAWQVEQTVAQVVKTLCQRMGVERVDYCVCYQSRVGRLKWIGPSTEEEIVRAGNDKTPVVLIPIAFVSEHSETLVELDIETKELAHAQGVPAYIRVPTLGIDAGYIATLKKLVLNPYVCEKRFCPPSFSGCMTP